MKLYVLGSCQCRACRKEMDREFWDLILDNRLEGPDSVPTGLWSVIESTPGYLPEDDEPPMFETLDEAKAYLREEVQRYVEQLIDAGETVDVKTDPDGFWAMVNLTGESPGRCFDVTSMEPEGEED